MKLLPLFALVFIINIAYAKVPAIIMLNKQVPDSTTLRAKKLKQLYMLSTASSSDASNTYKQQFFDEFPNSFKELNDIYGYNRNKPTPLYYEAEKHIYGLFNNLDNINDTLYYKKIVSIAVGGRWDGDAINYFQDGLRGKTLNNPALIVYALKGKSESQIKSFWYFYFDGPIVKKQLPESLRRVKLIDIKIYNLMTEAQYEVLKHPK